MSMTNLKKLGDKIREVRKEKKLTQEKLAELADVDPKSIIQLESGKRENPTVGTLTKVAKALKISLNELLN